MTALLSSPGTPFGDIPVTLLSTQSVAGSTGMRIDQLPRPSAPLHQDQIVAKHMVLVHSIARREHARLPSHIALEDLVSAGTLGLLDAITRFDTTRPVQFRSYAQFRVRGAILDYLRENDSGSRTVRRMHREIEATRETLLAHLRRAPTDLEVATQMQLEVTKYQRCVAESRGLTLERERVEQEREGTDEELERVPAPATHDPLLLCLAAERRERLRTLIDRLPEKQRLVLCLYYYEELTMREIGEVLSLPESRISHLHAAALRQLRSEMASAAVQRVAFTSSSSNAPSASRCRATHAEAGW